MSGTTTKLVEEMEEKASNMSGDIDPFQPKYEKVARDRLQRYSS